MLTGASGLNIWSGGSVPTPQRSARLYRALVNTGLASSVGGFLAPTAEPYLYRISATVAARPDAGGGGARRARRSATAVARDGVTAAELARVRAQLRARFVFDGGSVTDLAHQLGYFATIGALAGLGRGRTRGSTPSRSTRSTPWRAKYLTADNRTIGIFEPTGGVGRRGR